MDLRLGMGDVYQIPGEQRADDCARCDAHTQQTGKRAHHPIGAKGPTCTRFHRALEPGRWVGSARRRVAIIHTVDALIGLAQ